MGLHQHPRWRSKWSKGYERLHARIANRSNPIDRSCRQPASKSDGSAIYQTDGLQIGDGVIAPITGGAVDVTAVALRETTPPALTLEAEDLTATADLTFTGSFTVSAREVIENIGVATSYELLRSPISGNDVGDNHELNSIFSNNQQCSDKFLWCHTC